jgi:alpha-1,3-rhamnosyl/mannosyltransferase
MRVILNALSSYRLRTGVGSYAAHLAAELKAIAGPEVTAFPEGWMAPVATLAGRVMAGNSPKPASTHLFSNTLRSAVRNALKDLCERGFRRACRAGGFDLYHEPNFIPWECDLPTVATVHDLSVIQHPEWHPPERVAFHERRFAATLANCRHVVTVSESMRREIIATMGVEPGRVTAIPNGVRPEMRPLSAADVTPIRARLKLPDEYLLYVGTIEPRKNVLTLMRAYCSLDATTRSRCALVLAGPWGWGFGGEFAFLNDVARHYGVIHLGYVADGDLPALYSGAAALVYPSHYEGFGLPPVEMMACGGAVLATTAAAVREVCGDCVYYIHPTDEAGWTDAMCRVIEDPEWRRSLRDGVVGHARQYSWQRCARWTWRLYEQLNGVATNRRAA